MSLPVPASFSHPQMADVLILHLCCFFDAAHALRTISRVSTRFHRLMQSPLAKRSLRLRLSREEQPAALLDLVLPSGQLGRLENLDVAIPDRAKLIELPLSAEQLGVLVTHASRLHTLQLASVRLHHSALAALAGLPHLTSLSLDFTPTSSAGLTSSSVTLDQHYYSALLQLRHLRHLRFVCSWNGRAAFIARLSELNQLETMELRFKHADINEATTSAWAAGMPRLRQLLLHKMTPATGAEHGTGVFAPLVALPSLTRLELPHAPSSFAMYSHLTRLRSLSLLVAENTRRGTDSDIAPLAALSNLTHLALVNQEAQADALLQQIALYAPRSITSLQLSLDLSLTRAGCAALEQLPALRLLTLLNGDLQLDPTEEPASNGNLADESVGTPRCSSARFLSRLEYLHVTSLSLLCPLHQALLWLDTLVPAARYSASVVDSAPDERLNPLHFLSRHAQQLEVLRMEDAWPINLLPLLHCSSLRVLGDASPTLYGRGNRDGTRSNLLRHPALSDPLRDWLQSHRHLVWKEEWHRSLTLAPHEYAKETSMLPAWTRPDKVAFFHKLAEAMGEQTPVQS